MGISTWAAPIGASVIALRKGKGKGSQMSINKDVDLSIRDQIKSAKSESVAHDIYAAALDCCTSASPKTKGKWLRALKAWGK